MSTIRETGPTDRRRGTLAVAALPASALALTATALAPAQDLESQLDSKEAELEERGERRASSRPTIERYTDEIDQLTGEVATLRNREAIVQVRARPRPRLASTASATTSRSCASASPAR